MIWQILKYVVPIAFAVAALVVALFWVFSVKASKADRFENKNN